MGSGVEYCGTCLNRVREVIGGYCGTRLDRIRVVNRVYCGTQYLARGVWGITVVPGYMGLAGSWGGGGGGA